MYTLLQIVEFSVQFRKQLDGYMYMLFIVVNILEHVKNFNHFVGLKIYGFDVSGHVTARKFPYINPYGRPKFCERADGSLCEGFFATGG